MEKIIGTVPGKCRKKREKARLTLNNNPEISWHMKKSRRTYNGVHLNKKSNTQDVVEQSLTPYRCGRIYCKTFQHKHTESQHCQPACQPRIAAQEICGFGNQYRRRALHNYHLLQQSRLEIHVECKETYRGEHG